jgi:hypothetical protein
VRNIATGEDREVCRGAIGKCFSSTTPDTVYCVKGTRTGDLTLLSISLIDGHTETVSAAPDFGGKAHGLFLTRDNRSIYLAFPDGLVRWPIGSPDVEKVFEGPVLPREQFLAIASPDERWITRQDVGKIMIRALAGGDWRLLVSLGASAPVAFTQDGNWLVYYRNVQDKFGLFRISTLGGEEERLGDFPTNGIHGQLWISPNGQNIIATTLNPSELWMLENFEPKH